ncbi:hypothetical protein C7380_101147 [Oceanotoga teriensis]|uniref:Uncharacterized protein n=1 Tax=Oceanotoga teriensis TaxID=515440 RepID=A0AA45C953_9BACT|nr:hypothetical protein [Oceanotoga teriensis]PWJ96574.1 hypothetical protein C7380_101147 [Oceanotoga teriensis]
MKIKNEIIKTSILAGLFYILFISLKYLKIAPNIISFIMPMPIFFLSLRYSLIYTFVFLFLIFISGFVIESIGILLLIFLPVFIYKTVNKKILKNIIIILTTFISFLLMINFFGLKLPNKINSEFFMYITSILYSIFSTVYPILLKKLSEEVIDLISKYLD